MNMEVTSDEGYDDAFYDEDGGGNDNCRDDDDH